MNVVDSCGWLEYFANGAGADFFSDAIEDISHLIVPTICLYEVFKVVMSQRGEHQAIEAVAAMQQGLVVDIDTVAALSGARLSQRLKLPMADAMILAVSIMHQATLWTQDADFERIEGIRFRKK